MKFGLTALTIGAAAVLAQPALAGGLADGCDWYQNAVLGTRCAESWSFGVAVDYNQFNYGRGQYSSTDEHYTTTGNIAVTPTSWLTLSFGSGFVNEDRNWTFKGNAFSSSTSYTGQQTLQANVNLSDTGPGPQRYVINAYAGGFVTPSHGTTDENDGVFGGVTANGQWQLGSGMSILGQAQLQANSQSLNGDAFLYPHFRLLLSNDALGVAAGPVFNFGEWLSGNQAAHSQSSYSMAGGTAIVQPFRSSPSPFLNGMILQVTGQEAIGQAGWVSSSYAKTDQFDITGTVSFHFRY
jgi:hypothetical protein